MKYYACLINTQKCIFDSNTFSNLKSIKIWAKDRNNTYTLDVYNRQSIDTNTPIHTYNIRNNKLNTTKN